MGRASTLFFVAMGVFLASSASLAFQVALTRMFSIAQWYHYAFMVISLALLGYGASGTLLSRLRPTVVRSAILLPCSASLLSLGILASPVIINRIPFDPYRVGIQPSQLLVLAAQYGLLAVSFLFAGMVVAASLWMFPRHAGYLYGSSMAGAGTAGLLILAAGRYLETGRLVAAISLLAAVSSLSFCAATGTGKKQKQISLAIAVIPCVISVSLLVMPLPGALRVRFSPYKTMTQALQAPGASILGTKWNSFSRVDLFKSPVIHSAPGLSYTYDGDMPEQTGLAVDGENVVGITPNMHGEPAPRFVRYLPIALPYEMRHIESVLLISPQGGCDLLAAAAYGASRIVVVEPNEGIVELLGKPEATGMDIYLRHGTLVVHESGRSFCKRTTERFDLVTIALTDSLGPVTAGAFSLAENHLLTVEAFRDYLSVLKPDGLLSASRWLQYPPSECVRLGVTLSEAIRETAPALTDKLLVAYRTPMTLTVLAGRKPFCQTDHRAVREFCEKMRFDLVWLSGMSEAEANKYDRIESPAYFEAYYAFLTKGWRTAARASAYDISPCRDDRPFFLHFFTRWQIPTIFRAMGREWKAFGGLGFLLMFVILATALAASLVLIWLPLRRPSRDDSSRFPLLFGRERIQSERKTRGSRITGARLPAGPRIGPTITYFVLLGIAYLFVEITFIQRFVLVLAQPTYAFAIVLAALLVTSGCGSFLAVRLVTPAGLRRVLTGIAATVAVTVLGLPALTEFLLPLSFTARLAGTIAIIAPSGFLMGIPFPAMIHALERQTASWLIPRAWAANGCASVTASVLAMIGAVAWGYTAMGLAAAFLYGLTACFVQQPRSQPG